MYPDLSPSGVGGLQSSTKAMVQTQWPALAELDANILLSHNFFEEERFSYHVLLPVQFQLMMKHWSTNHG
jgi:hypothetical protein